MASQQNTPTVGERIQHIETSISPQPLLMDQTDEPTTIAERMAYYQTPGMSIALINNGEIEWAKGYGILETGRTEPVTPETIFQACSISKHVAMVGALRLVQEGLLDLDEDINRYLRTWKVPSNDSWQPHVTLRHLLGHTAGLTQNWFRGFRRGEPVPTLFQVLEGQAPANTPPVRVVLIPGSQFRYSGSHYIVLQQLLMDITGEPFSELMRELVFDPLEMDNSSYDQSYPETRPESTAIGHYIGGEPVYGKWRLIPEMAGAGLWTTASDLARLACEIQRAHEGKPTHVLKKELADQALTAQAQASFGLGTELEGQGQSQRFGHTGSNIGYRCFSTTYIEQGMGAVVLTNSDDGFWVILDLLRTVAQEYAWPNYVPKHIPVSGDVHMHESYQGEYELRPGFTFKINTEEEKLLMEVTGQASLELQPSSEVTFFAQAVNSEITFTKSETGQVSGFVLKQEEQEIRAKKLPPVIHSS
jgi:CubicO group peptidase (beta-lactamase class C family)